MAGNAGSLSNIRKKFHKIHDLISTSYHEAGHTIYGLLHGMHIESVLVFETKKTKRIEGFTAYHPIEFSEIQDPELLSDRLHASICLHYSGLVAEKRLFRMISGSEQFPMFLKEGSSTDFSEAAALIERFNLVESGRKRYNYKQKLLKEIDSELQDNWDAVTLVAHALIKKKKLHLPDLKTLLIKKSDDREFWKNQFKIFDELHLNSEPLDEKEIKSILLV